MTAKLNDLPNALEKARDPEASGNSSAVSVRAAYVNNAKKPLSSFSEKLAYYSRKLDAFGFESRGIERVQPEERKKQNWWALSLIW